MPGALFRRLRRGLALLACAGHCACGENVLQLGDPGQPATPLGVEQILLHDAGTGELLSDLASEPTLSIAALPSADLSLEAVVSGSAGSVEFIVDGDLKLEHELPFTYPGDTPDKLQSFPAELGKHTVTATPYSQLGAQGERGASLTRSFSFVN